MNVEYSKYYQLMEGIFLHINFLSRENRLYAKIVGELDHHSAAEIKEQTDGKIIGGGINTLIFDFSNLTFMDSSGIGVIIGRYKLMQSLGGRVYIISGNKNADRLLALSGITDIIDVVQNADEIDELIRGEKNEY